MYQYQQKLLKLQRDTADENDLYLSINLKQSDTSSLEIQNSVDRRALCPPVYEQGELNSCTANALATIFYLNLINGNYTNIFEPSRLFIYYNMRHMKQMVDLDEGGTLRDTLKAIYTYGVCPEEMWPYDVNVFKQEPPSRAYLFGQKHDSITYFRVPQLLSHLCQCLIDGYSFAFGMSVFSNLETDVTNNGGYVSIPNENDTYLGGHAVCSVGFDDVKKVFIIRNSWGEKWGDNGYFYLPYAYMTDPNLVFDIWTFRNKAEKPSIITQMIDVGTSTGEAEPPHSPPLPKSKKCQGRCLIT